MDPLPIAGLLDCSACREISAVLAAADELAAFSNSDGMLRRAVELARGAIGLERASIFIRDPRAESPRMRGTWGTTLSGQTTDEHTVSHECAPRDVEKLEQLHAGGTLWQYEDGLPLYADGPGGARLGRRWLAVTPLVAARTLIGVMYNDGARTNAPLDAGKQIRAAVFCSALAGLLSSRRGSLHWPEASKAPSPRIGHVLRRIQEDVRISGGALARELGISPGYLARSFRAEMGMSLVEYRNRRMLERFFEMVQEGESKLLAAALEAGFNSYTHFSRVHRQLTGSTATARLAQLEAAAPRSRMMGHHRE